MAGESISHKIEGLEDVLKKAEPSNLLAGAILDFFKRATLVIEGLARIRAPFRTGRLQDSITSRVDGATVPMWGEVGSGVTAGGVSYPTVLEMSTRTHYRATSRMGQPTRDWFSGSLPEAAEGIEAAKDKLGEAIKRKWTS